MDAKNILKDLVRFNTIKDKENVQIINYIEDLLKKKGFKTEYKSKCLVMSIKEKYNLGFIGHTDTVEYNKDWNTNPFEMQEKEGKIYVIRPPKALGIKRTEGNPQKLEKVYKMGRAEAKKHVKQIKRFLKEKE